ncbi:hypothetical protein EC973_000492 [Apophysomyces ossiformis]|uniref:Uncharacterized protein n=1 Tax=Apophysomyces ossiformis TaxID=679940 RepID=A0A8H7ENS5_9FUNG|nr:hypothetical protein EC973_000492 [Apophysomyces ossiformis]
MPSSGLFWKASLDLERQVQYAPHSWCHWVLYLTHEVHRFDPVDALTYTLIFDTTPVAFGALGIPVTTLAALTGLPVMSLSAMMGRQLPLISLFLPLYALLFYAGPRAGVLECWPAALVAGLSFAVVQAIFANLVGPELPDLIAGLVSLLSIIIFVQYWKPPYRAEYEANIGVKRKTDEETTDSYPSAAHSTTCAKIEVSENEEQYPSTTERKKEEQLVLAKPTWLETAIAWSPWVIIVVVVIIWTFAKVSNVGQVHVFWPHLHQEVWLTLYGKKYDAVWVFQPLATGTAILVSSIPFAAIVLLYGAKPNVFYFALCDTAKQLFFPILTVSFIMAFAYLYNYSVVAAREIGLSAVLMAATNSTGAITSKMISPQNLTTGVSTINLQGQEGRILRKTILHSILMVCIIGAMATVQQYAIPGIIPPGN